MAPITLRYFTDPFCPWSWAAEPAVRRIQSEFGAQVTFTYVLTGMGDALQDPGAYAATWLEASAWSGMPVDPRGLLRSPPRATHPAALAVKAVAEQGDPGPFLRRLREAIMLERRPADRGDALLDLARETKPEPRDELLKVAFGSNAIVEALGADLEAAREIPSPTIDVVPADGGGAVRVTGPIDVDSLVEAVRIAGARGNPEGPPTVAAALKAFGRMTGPEVAAACELAVPRAEAELWRLALDWQVRPARVLSGWVWDPV